MNKKIAFIGSGNMAEAIIKGLLAFISPSDILCVDINLERLAFLKEKYAVDISVENLKNMEIFVLAVKPQNANEAIRMIEPYLHESILIFSIMAGVRIANIVASIKTKIPIQIARVMPNTPALFSKGAIGYSFSETVNNTNREFSRKILDSIGLAIEVSENDLDAVTALSGSGPAYVFYLAEAMITAGMDLGLSPDVAKQLAIQTVYGSGFMLLNSSDDPKTLREKVTSKGGTTQAACEFFDDNNLQGIVKSALKKAKDRSVALST
ncbi:MAG: pyrroline-5-carboxylate reductase [bacterium]|nr:pyrroline-5-carboxylate reductase [bacterium]